MQLILFAKHLKPLTVPQLVKRARQWGLDGYDWPVRAGYAVNPDNVRTALPAFVRAMRAEGMDVPLCTADALLSGPDDPTVEPILATMAAQGIRLFKPGYDRYHPEADYGRQMDAARRKVEKWQALARKHGIAVCFHTHSGAWLGCNASALMDLIGGFDPQHIAAYLDAGHLAVAGELFNMACGIVGRRLRVVGVKDLRKVHAERDGKPIVQIEAVPKGRGATDFNLVFSTLARLRFGGPVTIHIEYPGSLPTLLRATGREARAYREAWQKAL